MVELHLPDAITGELVETASFTWVFDVAGQLLSETDALGRVTQHEYDALGRRTALILNDPDGAGPLASPEYHYSFDAASRLILEVAPNGGETEYEYDLLDNVVLVRLPAPDPGEPLVRPEYTYVFDAASQLVSETDPLGRTTLHTLDNLGREIETQTEDPDGAGPLEPSVWQFQFDAMSNLVLTIDPLLHETAQEFDHLHRRTKIIDALSGETSFTFDAASNLLSLTDPVGNTTSWIYDTLNRVVEEENQLSASRFFVYNAMSTLIEKTDRNGRVTQYVPDKRGRIVEENWLSSGDPAPELSLGTTTEGSSANEVQRVGFSDTSELTGGTFTLTFNSETTDPLAFDADAATVAAALEELASIGSGNVSVWKSQNSSTAQEWQLTFVGSLATANQGQVVIDTSAVESGALPTATTDTQGASIDEVQRVGVSDTTALTGGTFTLTFDTYTTGAIAFDASAGTVEAALEGLTSVGSGNVSVAKLTSSSTLQEWEITFSGSLSAANQTQVEIDSTSVTSSGTLSELETTDTTGASIDEVQRVGFTDTAELTGGTFTLSFDSYTTSAIAYNASAGTVESALEALTSIGSGNVSVSRTQNTSTAQEWQITFSGALAAANQNQITINTSGVTSEDILSPLEATDTAGFSTNEVQVVTLDNAVAGTFTLSFNSELTDPIPFDADDAAVQAALEALTSIGSGNVSVSGSAGGPWTMTFQGTLAGTNVSEITGDESETTSIYALRTFDFAFDEANQLLSTVDPDATFGFVYDGLGRTTEISAAYAGLTPEIVMAQTFDANSHRSQLAVSVGETADFVNDFFRDNLGRLTRLEQSGVGGGNSVAEKRVDFSYNAAGQYSEITRYADLAGTESVLNTAYSYDDLGRLTLLAHSQDATPLASYEYVYDVGSRITSIDSLVDGLVEYTYDNTSQLVGANFASQADETHEWDENGNHAGAGFDIGANNKIATDGTYNYEYDGEGNLILKTTISTGETVSFIWDHRNRLTGVVNRDDLEAITQEVHFAYDFLNRWIARTADEDGAGIEDPTSLFFVYDGTQIVLELASPTSEEPAHRYLWSEAVDHLLADENALGDMLHPLADHLNTVRDLAEYDAGENLTSIIDHIAYESFGKVVSESTPTPFRFKFTSRPVDEFTGLQSNWHRWYSVDLGWWLSEDPIGFRAGDSSLSRYVGNDPIRFTDPEGLLTTVVIYVDLTGAPATFNLPAVANNIRKAFAKAGINIQVSLVPTTKAPGSLDLGDERFEMDYVGIPAVLMVCYYKSLIHTHYVRFSASGFKALGQNPRCATTATLFTQEWGFADLYLEVLEGEKIDYDVAFANVIIHEVFWHGILCNTWHGWWAKPGDFDHEKAFGATLVDLTQFKDSIIGRLK